MNSDPVPFDPLSDPRGFVGGPEEGAAVAPPVRPSGVDLSTLITDREQAQKEAAVAQDEFGKSEEARIADEKAQLKAVSERMQRAEDEQMRLVAAKREAVDSAYRALPPQYDPKPMVNSQDFQNFSTMLTAIALIGGAVSKGNWMGVQATMNGAMEGYLDGDRERADREYQKYRTQFDTAYKKLEASQKDFDEVVYSTSLPINQMQREFQTLASLHGREDALAAARSGRIDKMRDRVAKYDEVIAKLKQGDEKLDVQWQLGLARLKAAQGGIAALNPDGKWAVETIYFGTGNRRPMQDILSRFGGPTAAHLWNDIGKYWKENHVDPKQWTAEQLSVNAIAAATRFTKVRQAAVERISGMIKGLEPKVVDMVKKVNSTNPNLANKYFNTLTGDMLGDFDVSQLTVVALTIGREYLALATMPGSNAQLFASSQATAEKLMNRDFSLQSLLGALSGINIDMDASSQSLKGQLQTLQGEVASGGLPTPNAPGLPNPNQVPGEGPPTILRYDAQGQRVHD